jgi:hypothetical protein
MYFGRPGRIPIHSHRAPPTKNRVLNKESQGIPADQERRRVVTASSPESNSQQATTNDSHDSRIFQVASLGGERFLWVIERLHTRLRYFCSPQHTDSALYPIISQMERAAGLARDDTQQAKLNKLDAVLAQTSTSIDDAALIAEMLSIPNDGRYPTLDLIPTPDQIELAIYGNDVMDLTSSGLRSI